MFEWAVPIETPYIKEYRQRARKRYAVIHVLQWWYDQMRAGTANSLEPNLSSKEVVTFKKPVNEIIAGIDLEFSRELLYNADAWAGDGITEAPHFSELSGKAKLCLVQDLRKVLDWVAIQEGE